jgi:hypothetical protein
MEVPRDRYRARTPLQGVATARYPGWPDSVGRDAVRVHRGLRSRIAGRHRDARIGSRCGTFPNLALRVDAQPCSGREPGESLRRGRRLLRRRTALGCRVRPVRRAIPPRPTLAAGPPVLAAAGGHIARGRATVAGGRALRPRPATCCCTCSTAPRSAHCADPSGVYQQRTSTQRKVLPPRRWRPPSAPRPAQRSVAW